MASEQDYHTFYQWEMAQRKQLNYPPWGRLILIRFSGAQSNRVEAAAAEFRNLLPGKASFDILGPAPAPLSRIKGEYRYHILLKTAKSADPSGSRMRSILLKALNRHNGLRHHAYIKVQIDVDPSDLM